MMQEKVKVQFAGEWGYCDDCMFYVTCKRPERREGHGCEDFEQYPYEYSELVKERPYE